MATPTSTQKVQFVQHLVSAVSECTKSCMNGGSTEKVKKEEREVRRVLKVLLDRNPTEEEVGIVLRGH